MDRIGPFRFLQEIGRGGMGVVYRAADENIGREVAVKVIRFDEVIDPEEREQLRGRLFREARAAGVLKHPGIVTIYYAGEEQGVAFIAMEYVDGPTLERVLLAGVPIDRGRIRQILRETAAALDYAHSKGIIHRDVKPANIMLENNESVKICDFGIAKGFTGLASMTQTGTSVGTPHYMPPEQIQGKAVDARADQYALAVISYQILTGRRPFQADSIHTLFYRILAEPPETANKVNPSLAPGVAAVFEKALSKEPGGRYATCREFIEALLSACDQSPDWSPPPRRGLSDTGLTPASGSQAATPLPQAARPAPPVTPASPSAGAGGFTTAFADLAESKPAAPPPPQPSPPAAALRALDRSIEWKTEKPAEASAPFVSPAVPEPPHRIPEVPVSEGPSFGQTPPPSRKPLYVIGAAAAVLILVIVALTVWPSSDNGPKPPPDRVTPTPSPHVVPTATPGGTRHPGATGPVVTRTPTREVATKTPTPVATPLKTPDLTSATCQALHLTPDKCAASPWAQHCLTQGVDPATCAKQLKGRRDACLDLGLSLEQCAERYH